MYKCVNVYDHLEQVVLLWLCVRDSTRLCILIMTFLRFLCTLLEVGKPFYVVVCFVISA